MSSYMRDYLAQNPLHQATRYLLASSTYSNSGTAADRFRIVASVVPPSIEECIGLRIRKTKNESGAPADAASALTLDSLNAAVARCGYEEDRRGVPSTALIRCLTSRIEYMLRQQEKCLDFASLLSDVKLVLAWAQPRATKEAKLLSRQLYIR